MVPLCSAGRTAYRGRKPPQSCQPQHDRPWRDSDKPARPATIFTHNGAPQALIGCIESRQAYQALKSLATHKTDRNDARGLAHLARTGFFKPVHVKSLPAHALRSLIIARKKLVGQRVTLENQIRGLAVVFGIRLPSRSPTSFALMGRHGGRPAPVT